MPAVALTRRAVVAFAVAALAPLLVPSAPGLALVAAVGVVLAAIISDVARAVPPADLEIVRHVPDAVTVGDHGAIALDVSNPTAARLEIALHDATPPSAARTPRRHVADLPAHGTLSLDAAVRPTRRGRFALGPVTLRTTGPLGLAARQAIIPIADDLVVFPRLPGRAAAELRVRQAKSLVAGERSTRLRGGSGEFDSLREYHPDDEFRRINWYATVRAGKPISNTYREERNQHVVLLLDTGRTVAGRVAGVPRIELGIDGAMAVAALAGRIGDHVGALAFAGDVRGFVPSRAGTAQSRRILESLFHLDASLDAPGYRRAFTTLLGRQRRRSLLVLITELSDPAAMTSLFETLPTLTARHLVVVGAVRDPELEVLAGAVPSDLREVHRKAAAAAALDAREQTTAHLRGLGATVIDASPDGFAGALLDAYLHVKAARRL